MKRFLSIFVVCCLSLSCFCVPLVLAQEEEMVQQIAVVTGTVVSVDLEKATVEVEIASEDSEEKSAEVFSVTAATTIEMAGEAVQLSDLAVGSSISVEYAVTDSGEMVAQMIWVE